MKCCHSAYKNWWLGQLFVAVIQTFALVVQAQTEESPMTSAWLCYWAGRQIARAVGWVHKVPSLQWHRDLFQAACSQDLHLDAQLTT